MPRNRDHFHSSGSTFNRRTLPDLTGYEPPIIDANHFRAISQRYLGVYFAGYAMLVVEDALCLLFSGFREIDDGHELSSIALY